MGNARAYPELRAVHYIRKTVNYNDAGVSSGVKIGTLPAGAQLLPGVANVRTVFNAGTTNVLTVGANATSYDNLAAAGDVDESSATVQALPAAKALYFSADADVYVKYTQSGTAASTGVATIIIPYTIDNDQ